MYRALPGGRLLRGLRPLPPPSADAAPCLPRRASATTGGFPRSLPFGRRGGGQLCPAGLPRRSRSRSSQSPGGRIHAAKGRSPRNPQGGRAPHGRPLSIGFEPTTSLAGVLTLVHLHYTVPPCLPRPRSPIVPARHVVVRAAPALARSSGVRLPSASPGRCDGPAVGSCTPTRSDSASWRTNSSRYTGRCPGEAPRWVPCNHALRVGHRAMRARE
jgi:hypothetical protein